MSQPLFSEGQDGREWIALPVVGGADVTLEIESYQKIEEENGERNFKSKTKNFGFHYIVFCTNKTKFSLNTWKLYYALQGSKVFPGDRVTISHPEKGEWKVKVLKDPVAVKRAESVTQDVIDEIGKRNGPDPEAAALADKFGSKDQDKWT